MKAVMQERGTEHGTEVMWFNTGNYTEMMQEVSNEVTINGSFPVATLSSSTAIFCRLSSLLCVALVLFWATNLSVDFATTEIILQDSCM